MNIDKLAHPVDILLVEDNPGDVRLTKELLKDSKIHNNLTVIDNGEGPSFICAARPSTAMQLTRTLSCWI